MLQKLRRDAENVSDVGTDKPLFSYVQCEGSVIIVILLIYSVVVVYVNLFNYYEFD